MSFWSQAWDWATGSSTSATLAKAAALGFGVKLLSDTLNESSSNKPAIDPGVRLQLSPDTENKIPVLYGTAFFSGNITDAQLSTDYKTMTYCLTLCETTGTTISNQPSTYQFNSLYLNNNRVVFKSDGVTVDYTIDRAGNQDTSFRDLVKVYFYANNQGIQPVGHSGTTPASSTIMPGWSTGVSMPNLVYAIVQVNYNRDKGVTGLPTCVFQATNSMTLPGDVLNDYMLSTRYGAGIASIDISGTYMAVLNTFCSAGFNYINAAGQTVNAPITINGLIDTNQPVLSNMEEIAKSSSCWLTYDIHRGQWLPVINRSTNPAFNLTESNIIGEIAITGTSLTQLSNIADVKYLNNDILDKPDFVKITLPTNELYANEPRNSLQLTLPYTNKQAVALKLGAQLLKQARVDKIITFTTDYSRINCSAGTVISITSPVYGFVNKAFRVITAEETQGDDGELTVTFTALEYNASVYDFAVTEFQVETNDGIIQIGSIGKPGVPQVSKIEQDSRPRITIQTLTPSGVVEGVEFWLSNDTAAEESSRVYRLIASRKPSSQGLYTEDTLVEIEYDALNSSDFVIKTRGFNSQVFGPYSDPSGFIEFRPIQVTQAIGPDTTALGGLIGALTVIDLLKSVDDLIGDTVGKSIIDGVLDTLFPDRTSTATTVAGLLLDDQDYTSQFAGTINDLGNISIDALMDVDTTLVPPETGNALVWNGSIWAPGAVAGGPGGSATDIKAWGLLTLGADTVTVNSSFGIAPEVTYFEDDKTVVKITFAADQIGPGYVVLATKGTALADKSAAKGYDVFGQTEKIFYLSLEGAEAGDLIHFLVIGEGADIIQGGAGIGACPLVEDDRFPADRATQDDPLEDGAGDLHPVNDKPSITYETLPGYTLMPNTGNVSLYRSNGVRDQLLPASSLVVEGKKVTFPFADLDYGTDYYILMDPGALKAVDESPVVCYSNAITSPLEWNFHTRIKDQVQPIIDREAPSPATPSSLPPPVVSAVLPPPDVPAVASRCQFLNYVKYQTESKAKDSNNLKVDPQSNITVYFDNPIVLGNVGQVTIYKKGGQVWQAFDVAYNFNNNRVSELLWTSGNTLVINSTVDFEQGGEYYLLMTANAVMNSCGAVGNAAITNSSLITWKVDAGPVAPEVPLPKPGESINRMRLTLPFDRPVEAGNGTIRVYDGNNNLVAERPATDPAVKIS